MNSKDQILTVAQSIDTAIEEVTCNSDVDEYVGNLIAASGASVGMLRLLAAQPIEEMHAELTFLAKQLGSDDKLPATLLARCGESEE